MRPRDQPRDRRTCDDVLRQVGVRGHHLLHPSELVGPPVRVQVQPVAAAAGVTEGQK